ncbi:MAG: hypothetical protein M3Z92_10185 [Bacteroidota bacterium]|nr:hypothetical protein [Bacteroidota bacterium]
MKVAFAAPATPASFTNDKLYKIARLSAKDKRVLSATIEQHTEVTSQNC